MICTLIKKWTNIYTYITVTGQINLRRGESKGIDELDFEFQKNFKEFQGQININVRMSNYSYGNVKVPEKKLRGLYINQWKYIVRDSIHRPYVSTRASGVLTVPGKHRLSKYLTLM